MGAGERLTRELDKRAAIWDNSLIAAGELMMLNFTWWRDKDNREGAKTIVDLLKVAVPALVLGAGAIWGVIYATEEKPAEQTQSGGGVTVSTGDGSPVIVGDGNNQTTGQ